MKQLVHISSFLLIFWALMLGCNSVVGVDDNDFTIDDEKSQNLFQNAASNDVVQYTLLDSFESEGLPVLKGDVKTDGENLVLVLNADPMAISGSDANIAWMIYTGDSNPDGFDANWSDSYFLADEGSFINGEANETFLKWGVGTTGVGGGGNPSQTQNQTSGIPEGITVEYEADGIAGIWKLSIPYSVIDVEEGDIISYVVGSVYQDADTNLQSRNFSHGDDLFAYINSNVFKELVLEHDPVPSVPETKSECKNGGWENFDFRNQGQCIRFVNTGQDSR